MTKFKFGDKVWHDIEPCGFGVVLAIENGECHVKFRSGTMDWFSESELTPASDWVKCSERMPEIGDMVLVFNGNSIEIDALATGEFSFECWCDSVTHWMPLPEMPEVKE